MLEMTDGRIKMTAEEEDAYLTYSGASVVARTKSEFTSNLKGAAQAMRERLASGDLKPGDRQLTVDLIEIHLLDPHAASACQYLRDWRDAGEPIGPEALRKSGLKSAALDYFDEQDRQAAIKPPV